MADQELISDRIRDVGDGLVLGFPIETADVANQQINTVRLYFFRVASQTRYFQRYTSLSDIASDATTPLNGYDYLGNTGVGSGDDIFRISTDDWHLMQFGFATAHPDLHVYTAVSPASNGNPAQDRTGQGEDITPGSDERGYFDLAHIDDQYDPPADTERLSFRNDKDGEFLQWAFYNDGDNTLSGGDLDFYLTGRGYKLQPVVEEEMQTVMLQSALASPNTPTMDTVYTQIGGLTNYTFGTEEPEGWGTVRESEPAFTTTFNLEDVGPPWGRGSSQQTVQVSGD